LTPEMQEVAISIMESLDCARSLSVAILIRSGEWDQLVQLRVDPRSFVSPETYLLWSQATDLLRKVESLPVREINREKATEEKWLWAERQCYRTNQRLSPYLDTNGTLLPLEGQGASLEGFFLSAKKAMRWLIGNSVPLDLTPKFGPGATVSDPSVRCLAPDKMSSTPTATSDCDFLYGLWIETAWGRAAQALGNQRWSICRGNEYFTVPKDATILRACAKGPSINVSYQLAVGKQLRRRLRLRGLDLDHAQEIHRQVACAASKSGEFATIDLSSASDCVSTALVKLLLPNQWHDLLYWLREPLTKVPASVVRRGEGSKPGKVWYLLEKFSAMGNGFTFELETAVFTALIMGLDGSLKPGVNMWVFGDDIIVPTHLADAVISMLRFCGFTPNPRKTFLDSEFRESCGGDFFAGQAVRPYLLKEFPNEPQEWITFANGLRRMASQNALSNDVRRRLTRSWFRILDRIPVAIRRCRGPEALGDIVIHDEEARWVTRIRGSIRYVRCYRPAVFRKVYWWGYGYDVQMASALYGLMFEPRPEPGRRVWNDDSRYLVPRDGVMGYKVGWAKFS